MASWQIVAGYGCRPGRKGKFPDLYVGLTPAGSAVRTADPHLSRFSSEAAARLVARHAATPWDAVQHLEVVASDLPPWDADSVVSANGLAGECFDLDAAAGGVYRATDPAAVAPMARREALYLANLIGRDDLRVEAAHAFA